MSLALAAQRATDALRAGAGQGEGAFGERVTGRVAAVDALSVEVTGLGGFLAVGSRLTLASPTGPVPAEVVALSARGARAVADAGGATGAEASASAAEAPAGEAQGAAPTKAAAPRPRSRTRKPAAKPAE